jgi:hypothetical protein
MSIIVKHFRDSDGKYAKRGKLVKMTVLIIIGFLVSFVIGSNINTRNIEVIVTKTINTLQIRIDELKNGVVKDLQGCESAGYKEDDGIIIFDSNGKASIGTLQFQKKTVIYYYKTLYGEDITSKEAVLIALDNVKAEKLTRDIIFKTDKGLANWKICTVKHNLESRVKLIKAL